MTILLWHFLIPYGLFVALFVLFAGINVLHMVKFGTYTFANYLALAVFLAGTALILWATAQLLTFTDWSQTIGSIGAGLLSSTVEL